MNKKNKNIKQLEVKVEKETAKVKRKKWEKKEYIKQKRDKE